MSMINLRKHEAGALHLPPEFPIEDVETWIPAKFERMVAQYPDNWAALLHRKLCEKS